MTRGFSGVGQTVKVSAVQAQEQAGPVLPGRAQRKGVETGRPPRRCWEGQRFARQACAKSGLQVVLIQKEGQHPILDGQGGKTPPVRRIGPQDRNAFGQGAVRAQHQPGVGKGDVGTTLPPDAPGRADAALPQGRRYGQNRGRGGVPHIADNGQGLWSGAAHATHAVHPGYPEVWPGFGFVGQSFVHVDGKDGHWRQFLYHSLRQEGINAAFASVGTVDFA